MNEHSYTNQELMDICGDDPDLQNVKELIIYMVAKDPNFNFKEYITKICTTKNRQKNRKWKRIYDMLYKMLFEDLPLYVSVKKKAYRATLANWRLLNGR